MQFRFMVDAGPRPRVSVAVLREGGAEVLMVQHRRRDGSTYWELPGGGLHEGESAEAGALRELLEETGLHGRVVRWLFSIPYRNGSSSTFLVEIDDGAVEVLGSDPEEAGQEFYKLIGVAWRAVSEAQESPEVRTLGIVLSYLDRLNGPE